MGLLNNYLFHTVAGAQKDHCRIKGIKFQYIPHFDFSRIIFNIQYQMVAAAPDYLNSFMPWLKL